MLKRITFSSTSMILSYIFIASPRDYNIYGGLYNVLTRAAERLLTYLILFYYLRHKKLAAA